MSESDVDELLEATIQGTLLMTLSSLLEAIDNCAGKWAVCDGTCSHQDGVDAVRRLISDLHDEVMEKGIPG